jgi:NAD(P)-dependent dehydrogenase (short-subunit alcohol dehydrogenase family)
MRGKTCVITGATSEIGLETAKRFGALSWCSLDATETKTTPRFTRLDIEEPVVAVEMHYADLSRRDEICRVVDVLLPSAGRIDVLVNNAGALFATYVVAL